MEKIIRSTQDIKDKIKEMNKYLETNYNKSYEMSKRTLELVLKSSKEDIDEYYNHIVTKIAPIETYAQRQELKKQQEDFYKNLKGLSKSSKKYAELFEKWCLMDVPEYNEYEWGAYHAMRWLVDGFEL